MAKQSDPKPQKKKSEVSVREAAELEREVTRGEQAPRGQQAGGERGEPNRSADAVSRAGEDEGRQRKIARLAILLDDTFDDAEFRELHQRLRGSGHDIIVIGRVAHARLTGRAGQEEVTTDFGVREVVPEEFDAVIVPGGFSPDYLRGDAAMVEFTREVFEANKPVAAIDRGGWMLIEPGLVEGHTVTSWPSLKTDLINAGARWTDREVVEDGNLITSRSADDVPAFCAALLRQLSEGVPKRRVAPLAPRATVSQPPRV